MTASAQVTREETVTGRLRPDLKPLGTRVGSFLVFPRVQLEQYYEDNIFFTDDDEESDFITAVRPAISLQSDWNRHAINFLADARAVRYWDNDDENYEDFTLAGNGRFDVTSDTNFFGGAGYRLRHEDRSSPDDVRGLEPTEIRRASLNGGMEQRFNRVILRPEVEYEQFTFEDVATSTGSFINNSDRDRSDTQVGLRAAYELAPRRELFVRGTYNWRDYDDAVDDQGFDRDSDGYEFVVGANYTVSELIAVEGFLGYRDQEYDDARFEDVDGVSAGANLVWNVTRLTTIIGGLETRVVETTFSNASGALSRRANLRVDHELLRNLLLYGRIGFRNDDYEGINRDDDYYDISFGATYELTRNFSISGGYSFIKRDSSIQSADADLNQFVIRIGARL